jgi:protein-arginine deiminase
VQRPFEVDIGWLCVGHVDEFISWVPDPSAPKGFWMLIADTTSAWEILESMDSSTLLPRYSAPDGHGYAKVAAILADAGLRRANDEIQELLDATVDQFAREAGIDESDIIRIPDLFEPVPGYGGCSAAMIPGMVNMIIANFGEGDDHLFMADPFLRGDLSDQTEDPFIARMHDLMPDRYQLHFLDDWASYHFGLGEVHCGTNVQREPAPDWWNTAGHLLEMDR